MVTTTSTFNLPKESALPEYPLVYEICNRSASTWKQKNPDPRKQAKVINSSKMMMLSMKSRWRAGDRLGNVDIMYVPGAPTIFVNDYIDTNGQVQPGLKKLYGAALDTEHYNRAVKKGVCFVDGYLYLENFGGKDDRLLAEYVYHHALNQSSPNYKPQRDINTTMLFKVFAPEEKATIKLADFDRKAEGYALFYGLRSKAGQYETTKINAIMGMFNLGGELGVEDNAQKLLQLAPIVNHDAAKFMDIHDEFISKYRSTVAAAIELGVLTFTSENITMKIGDDVQIINNVTDTNATVDQKIEDVVYWLLGERAGQAAYSRIQAENDALKLVGLGTEIKTKNNQKPKK